MSPNFSDGKMPIAAYLYTHSRLICRKVATSPALSACLRSRRSEASFILLLIDAPEGRSTPTPLQEVVVVCVLLWLLFLLRTALLDISEEFRPFLPAPPIVVAPFSVGGLHRPRFNLPGNRERLQAGRGFVAGWLCAFPHRRRRRAFLETVLEIEFRVRIAAEKDFLEELALHVVGLVEGV